MFIDTPGHRQEQHPPSLFMSCFCGNGNYSHQGGSGGRVGCGQSDDRKVGSNEVKQLPCFASELYDLKFRKFKIILIVLFCFVLFSS